MFQISLALRLSSRWSEVPCKLSTTPIGVAGEQQRCSMDIGCYSLQNSLSPVEVRFVCLIPLVGRRSSFRTLNQVQSALHYRQSHTQSRTIIALLAIILTLLIFIFYRQIIRAWVRSVLFRRNGLQSSASNSNFNHRYQLLTSVVVDDSPASSSNMYSNGRNTPVSSSSSSYGGRLRSV